MTDYVLGISAYYHDSAAALVRDGTVVAAAQEERFSRIRHDPGFPASAVAYCLDHAGISLGDLTRVVYYEDPALKFRRVLDSFASAGPGGLEAFSHVLPEWLRWKRKVTDRVDEELRALKRGLPPRATVSMHHRSHAASAFYPSPFETAAVLTIDGVGEQQTTTVWHGRGNELQLVNSLSFPHSVGMLYSAFTYYCGFKVDSGEYKLMGLAPYGEPRFADLIRDELVNIREDGSFTLNMDYFEFHQGSRMVGPRFEELFGAPVRDSESELEQRHCDLAASVQCVTEEIVLGLVRAAVEMTGETSLVMAGGVALNCVANGVISRSGLVDQLWIQPAAGDAGCAVGAALDVAVPIHGRPHLGVESDGMSGALLGPSFTDDEIETYLRENGYVFQTFEGDKIFDETASHLASGAVVGWFQGRMEFGPRALGSRSILGDPRDSDMQKRMNLKIKFRESFRPFAPAVLADDATTYFDLPTDSPYMLVVGHVAELLRTGLDPDAGRGLGSLGQPRSELPAITHVDMSARVQTVTKQNNEPFANLLDSFKHQTGCPVLVNTSFNVRGEPIVNTPEDAYRCFMRTGMDVLVLGSHLLIKDDQPAHVEAVNWRDEIPLD